MKTLIRCIAVFMSVVVLTNVFGCVGPATQELHHQSFRWDPQPKRYIAAYRQGEDIFVSYEPGTPHKEWEEVLSTQYWARTTMAIVEDRDDDNEQWRVYRRHKPRQLKLDQAERLEIIDISGVEKPSDRTFLNRDQFLTWIIDDNNLKLPVLLIDLTNYHRFHLVGERQIHGSYRGLWNEPKESFRNKTVLALNSWKYPFYMTFDFIMMPVYMLFTPRWN